MNMSQIPPVIPLDGTTISCSSDRVNEESSQVNLLSSTMTLPTGAQQQQQQQQRQNNFSSSSCTRSSNLSGTIDSSNISTEAVGSVGKNDSCSMMIDMITSSLYNDEKVNEQKNNLLNESKDEVNLTSLSYLESSQRRIDHRRNKSEPLIRSSLEDISSLNSIERKTIFESSSTSTTSNESSIISNTSFDKKKKSSKNSPTINLKQNQEKSSSISSSATKKRKSWYNPFQATYRQRHEEFRKVFKDLPHDERLIVDYSCAWQKEILIQGRMYISQNYCCFHANFLKWETSLCLKFQDIVAITREKTAKVIPNAIEIRSNKGEKYFFASFATRDKSYAMIFRIWQTILIDQPISSQDLWKMIHESYGNNLDMTTDEEDNYQKQSIHSTPERTSPKQQIKQKNIHRVSPSSIRSKSSSKEERDDRSSISSHCEHQSDDDVIPIGEEANRNTLIRQPHSMANKEQNCLTSIPKDTKMKYLSKCPCQSHLSTQLIDRTYPVSVERLFDYIFGGDTDFLVAYHASRRIKDFHANEWKTNEETGKRERMCTYKVDVTAVFGATTICSNEKQIIDCELSNSHYILDTEVRNEGIKYADTFFIASRYCLVQIAPNKSHLKVTCEVRYVKSVMMIIKSFIEKNAMAALQDSFTDLNNRIDLSTSAVKRLESQSLNRQRSSSINNDNDQTNSRKKHSRRQQSNHSPIHRHRKQISQEDNRFNSPSTTPITSTNSTSSQWSINQIFVPFCLITMLILLTVNIFLCIKLNEIDRMTDRLMQNPSLWSKEYPFPKEDNQWSILFKRQEEYYQNKFNGLHSILISTHKALKNVTDALSELSNFTTSSTANAPINHLHSL